MKLDKELYRKAYESYRQWNEDVLIERARNAGKRTPLETWREYVDLWESVRQMRLKPGKWQRAEKIKSLENYYRNVQQLENWRCEHGNTTRFRPSGSR